METRDSIFAPTHQHPPAFLAWWQRLTIADGLLLLIVVMAGVIRLTGLGHLPLSPEEAKAALNVWSLWHPNANVANVSSPAYFTLTTLLTQILGYSDVVMRLVPALFGTGFVLLPWLIRQRLGKVGTLVTSLLLAVSPLGVSTARMANGDSIALFALLLFFAGWLRYEDSTGATGTEEGDIRWFYVIMGAVALGLTSSRLFYGGLVTLLLAWRLNLAVEPSLLNLYDETWPRRDVWQKTAVFGLVVFLALASLFLWYLPELGGVATLLGSWLKAFTLQKGSIQDWLHPFLALIQYESVIATVGLFTMVWALWQNKALANFALFWIGSLVVLMLLQRQDLGNVLLITLPGYLLLGVLAESAMTDLRDSLSWLFAAGLLLMIALIFVNVARFSRVIAYDVQDLSNVWLALFAFAFTTVTIYFLWTWDQRATYQGTVIALVAFFTFYQWGSAWWLGHAAANDVRERWVTTPATDDDLPMLITTIRQVSDQASGDEFDAEVFSGVDTPVLRWYLRDFPHLHIGQEVPLSAQTGIIISSDQADPILGSDYFGSDFGLLRTGVQPESLSSPTPTLDTLRWWLFHESHAQVTEERVVLWIRTDLIRP